MRGVELCLIFFSPSFVIGNDNSTYLGDQLRGRRAEHG